MSLKRTVKRAFYPLFVRSALVRGLFYRLQRLRKPADYPSVSHLGIFGPNQIGPVQPDEALLLFALARATRPRVIVEFGFNLGHSALNFALACPDAALYSYDVEAPPEEVARRCFGPLANFTFLRKSQTEFDGADVGGRPVDLVFIDASHDLAINQETFRRLLPHLSPAAIVAVHDTGVWERSRFAPIHREIAAGRDADWLDGGLFQHRREERLFVNWIVESHPGFGALHVGTERVLRHGLTLVQRRILLPTGPDPR